MTTFTSLEQYQFYRKISFLKSIFMDKRGKPSSEIWKDVHISLLATVRRWKQIYSLQNKKKAQNLQDGGKMPTFGWWLTNSCWLHRISKLQLQRKFSIWLFVTVGPKLHVTKVPKAAVSVVQSKTRPGRKSELVLPYRCSWNGVRKIDPQRER